MKQRSLGGIKMDHNFAKTNYHFIHTEQFKKIWHQTDDETRDKLQKEIDKTIKELSEKERKQIDNEFN